MSIIVYHESGEEVCDVMNGHLFRVPSGEPYEFASTFLGRKFIEHKHWWGVVEVKTIRTRQGIQFDLEDAKERAQELLKQKDQEVIQNYINTQYDDRLAHGKPALKPGGRAAQILAKHSINLAQYGIRPVGTLEGNLAAGTPQADPAMAKEVADLKKLVLMLLAGDTLNKEEKAQIVREMLGGSTPAGAPAAAPSQLHAVPEISIGATEQEIEATLGQPTEGGDSLPGDPATDGGVIDLGRSYAQLGTAPGVEEVPPTTGPQGSGGGNMARDEISSTLGKVAVVAPAATARRRQNQS